MTCSGMNMTYRSNSVSYTHLDVYKRQVSVQLRNKEAAAKNSMELDGFECYFDKMEFFKDGEPIELSKTCLLYTSRCV